MPAPEELRPIDAILSLRLIQRRTEALVRHGRRTPAFGSARIPAVLAAADRRLRDLLGEGDEAPSGQVPQARMIHAREAADISTPTAGLMSVRPLADRLVCAIAAATSEDWYQRRNGEDVSAAEVVSVALHDTIHCLDAVEQASPWGTGEEAPVISMAVAAHRVARGSRVGDGTNDDAA